MGIVLRTLHFAWVWLIYLPLVILTMLMVAVTVLFITPLLGASRTNRWLAMPWARLTTTLLPARVVFSGYWPLSGDTSFVVVANHQSQFDIPVLLGWLGLDLRWVMKQELMRVPGVGFGAKALGHIPIDRRNGERARAQISAAVAQMSGATGLMFFPEGTRSRDGQLLPFKSGAFRIAIQQQMPLLPITIVGTRMINPPGTFWLRPGTVQVVVHEPIATEGLDERAVDRLMQQTRDWMAQQLNRDDLIPNRDTLAESS